MTEASDERATILNAIISGTPTKILFRLGEPNDADYMVRVAFAGFVDLEEWKQGSARPTAVGTEKVIVHGTSDGEQTSEHEMKAYTQMRAHAHGTFSVEGEGTGVGDGSGDMASQLSTPPLAIFGPNADNASMIPVVLSQTSGTSSMRNQSSQTSRSHGTSDVHSEGEAFTVAHGTTLGRSHTTSENETYIAKYKSLPTQLYSLPEQLHRLAGEVSNLALRECFVRIGNSRPVRTRTVDLEPAFKSDYFRRVMLPIYQRKASERSPYLFPVCDVDAQIAARLPSLNPPPQREHDFTAREPMPVIDAPVEFARDFWKTRTPPQLDDPPKPPKPKGRRPSGDLGPEHDRFRIVDGDKEK